VSTLSKQKMSKRRAQAEAQAARRRRLQAIGIAAGVVVVVVVAVIADIAARDSGREPPATTAITGVQTFTGLERTHVEGPVTYPQVPPVGGPHNPVWQNCGYYDQPVRNENAVHSLEHGAAWITYRPDLPADQVARLRQLGEESYVLVSPYPGLPAPVVVTTWGRQLRLQSTGDPELEQFIRTYKQGPDTPEPGAPCTQGIGSPR
jgi:hypothetical protein